MLLIIVLHRCCCTPQVPSNVFRASHLVKFKCTLIKGSRAPQQYTELLFMLVTNYLIHLLNHYLNLHLVQYP